MEYEDFVEKMIEKIQLQTYCDEKEYKELVELIDELRDYHGWYPSTITMETAYNIMKEEIDKIVK